MKASSKSHQGRNRKKVGVRRKIEWKLSEVDTRAVSRGQHELIGEFKITLGIPTFQQELKRSLWDLVWIATRRGKLLVGGMVTIHSSGQTIFGFTPIEGSTIGVGEENRTADKEKRKLWNKDRSNFPILKCYFVLLLFKTYLQFNLRTSWFFFFKQTREGKYQLTVSDFLMTVYWKS